MVAAFSGKKYTKQQALEKIKWYCANQERCHTEVRRKLYQWGLFSNEVEEVLSTLITENFVDELRFAEAYVSGKIRIKHWGRNKIKAGLVQLQISKQCISKAMASIDEEAYLQNLQNLAKQKTNLLDEKLNSYERNAKIARFLQGKGYEYSLIKEILQEL